MTCSHCCDTNKFFDAENASKELKKYVKKGPTGSTAALLKAVSSLDKENKSLLDIGGGIGILQWEFLKQQAISVTDVDASRGYLEMAKSIAREFNYEDKTNFREGDFNDLANELEPHDFVTLDKVVCCYPDYNKLLNNAMSKSKSYLVLSYPLSNVISKALNWATRIYFKFKRSDFKTYIHSSRDIQKLIIANGFEQIHRSIKFPWNIQVYKKLN